MRLLCCILLIAATALCQTFTCSTGANCSAYAGQAITITSSAPTTFTLTGGGTCSGCGTAGTTSVTYTAPTGLIPQNQLLGCPVLPNDTIFNQRIDNASFPLDPNSGTKIGNLAATGLTFQPSWGTTYADSSTPLRSTPYLAFYNSVSYPNFPVQPSQSLLLRESGNKTGALNMGGVDQHIQTVNRSSCTFYETYKDYLSGYTQTCHDGTTSGCNVESATSYTSVSYTFPSSSGYNNGTDAAGMPLASLTLHLDEVKAAAGGTGAINHATRFTLPANPGPVLWPASPVSGTTSTASLVYGDRIRLKSSFSIPGVCGSSPAAGSAGAVCTAILTAQKQYGRIFADIGTNNADTANQDLWSDPAVYAGLQLISAGSIQPSNYEVVNEQSLESAANSYRVASQSYASPVNQVTVSGSGGGSVAVALQPAAIGSTLYTTIYAEAGSYSVNLAPFFWVNPSAASQTINFGLGSVTGTCTGGGISGSGVLTLPTTSPCSFVINAQSAYDSAAVRLIYVTVLPQGTNPANSVRIDSGKTTATTDPGTGYVWQADLGMLGMASQNGSDNPWPQTPDPLIYQSIDYAYSNDLHTQMLVPNGNYQVHLLFGFLHQGGGCNNAPCGTWPTTLSPNYYPLVNYLPIWAETQGNTVLNNYDWGWATNYLYTTPTGVYLPATVTNNLLELGLGVYAPDAGPYYTGANYGNGNNGNKYPQINGIEVLPDSTSAYLSIDPAANQNTQNQIVTGSSTSPFYAIQHYFSGGTVTWSIPSGQPICSLVSCSVSSDGWGDGGEVLTLGSPASGVTVYAGQPIQVTAANGIYTATVTFYTSALKYLIQ
jgi:hypothetical protein